uniref:Uncharacterized protein n=1 Tax=Solanum lycopersicum TaxID=4081 RepID=A0A3Q7HDW9_SOLLC
MEIFFMKYIGTGHTISPPFPLITYKMWMFMKVNGAQLTLLSFGTSFMMGKKWWQRRKWKK